MFKYFLAAMAALAVFLSNPAFADELKMNRTLSLSGHGEVRTAPDLAFINMGVMSSAATAHEALNANTRKMNDLMAELQAAGISAKDIMTSNFSVNPRYDYGQNNGQPAKLVGYDVSNSVSVTLRKIENMGTLLDKAVSSGSNQINGISFAVANPETQMDEARQKAVQDATRKAKIYADAAGIGLGPIASISESSGTVEPPQMMVRAKAMAADAAAPVPIAQGEQVVSVDVNMVWEIK